MIKFKFAYLLIGSIVFSFGATAANEKVLSRRAFLIGSSGMVAPLILPRSVVIPDFPAPPSSPVRPDFLWLLGNPGTGKSETLDAIARSGFSIVDLAKLDFMQQLGQVTARLPTSRVVGAVAEGRSLSVAEGQLVFAEEPILQRGLGWQSIQVLNKEGKAVDSLVRVVNPKKFDTLFARLSRRQVKHDQSQGTDKGCHSIFTSASVPRVIVEGN